MQTSSHLHCRQKTISRSIQFNNHVDVAKFMSYEVRAGCLCSSVLDLNAFERQNKAEGLGMVTEEGSGMIYEHKHLIYDQ